MIKETLRGLIDSHPLGDRVRMLIDKPNIIVRPFDKQAPYSDLFPWRSDRQWETRLGLINAPSFISPDSGIEDRVNLVIFGPDGHVIAQDEIRIAPMTQHTVLIDDYVSATGGPGYGTFACFHHTDQDLGDVYRGLEAPRLVERGYLGFRKRGGRSWSYVHGNLHAVAMTRGGEITGIMGHSKTTKTYRPQLRLDDCRAFDVSFTNGTSKRQSVTLRLLDEDRGLIEERSAEVDPLGLHLFSIDRSHTPCHMIESAGAIPMWRGVIFKYFDTHLDVLHS